MKKKILYTLVLFITSLSIGFFVLKNGIFISSIQLDFLKLEQLYIKIDKKFIVHAKNIIINEQDGNFNFNKDHLHFLSKELLNIVKNLNYLYIFVQEIDIKNLKIKDNHMRILFKNDQFFIDNDSLFLKLLLHKNQRKINVKIEQALFKDYDLTMDGHLSINTKSQFYHFTARAANDLITFRINLSYKDQNLAYRIEDINIKNIDAIFNQIKTTITLPQPLILWVLHRSRGDFYHFDFIEGFIDFARNNYYFNDINALGYISNFKLTLDDGMDAIVFPRIDLNLSKQRLDFIFDRANYNGSDLGTSEVFLYDVFDERKQGIYLFIQSDNLKLDQSLVKALQNYDLNLPFYQKSGKLKGYLELKIDFHDLGESSYKGQLRLENASLSLADFHVKKALIRLNENNLSIENASVRNDFLQANVNATIDLVQYRGVFDTKISRLYFGDGKLLDMRDENLLIHLDYTEDVKLSIAKWDLLLHLKEGLRAYLNKPKIFITHSPLLQKFGFIDAKNIHYESANFDDFSIRVEDAYFQNNLFIKDKKPYENDSFNIVRKGGILSINTKSDLISAKLGTHDSIIDFKNLSYVYRKNETNSSFELAKNTQDIVFIGENFSLILEDLNKTLIFDKLQANIRAHNLSIKALRKAVNFDLYYSPYDFRLFVKNMDDNFLNEFLQKEAVYDGVFNLSIVGSALDYFDGEFKLKNTFIKNFKGINQLISFIDTVPSLLLFRVPTFNQRGLDLREGRIIFNRKKDLFSFNAISLNGASMDVYGLGSANLRLNTIDVDLELKTLKSASKTISRLPILNYVILGRNQEISTNIKVAGALDNPTFHTQILRDTLRTPFNLIRNIIQLPNYLLN